MKQPTIWVWTCECGEMSLDFAHYYDAAVACRRHKAACLIAQRAEDECVVMQWVPRGTAVDA